MPMHSSDDHGYLSDEIAEVTARAHELVNKDADDDFSFCYDCGFSDHLCECCPTGMHTSVFDAKCQCITPEEKRALLIPDPVDQSAGSTQTSFNLQPGPINGDGTVMGQIMSQMKGNNVTNSDSKWTTEPVHVHKPVLVIDEKDWSVSCGKGWNCEDQVGEYDVILNLTGRSVMKYHKIPLEGFEQWAKDGKKCTEVLLDWPDYGTVGLPVEFWLDLIAYLKTNKKSMLVFCVGGHGRTGTAMASLLVAALDYTAGEAIDWLRENYCPKAVESKKQVDYVYDMSDAKTAWNEKHKSTKE